jgi:hypothetical protein
MEEFVKAATSGRRARADALSAGATGPWAALVRGERWEGDPNAPGGPNGWAPLLHVTHSVYASPGLARELLARGADPNVTFSSEYGEMSALYGAAGVVHDPELTRLLLEAGADPDDGESVDHAAEAEDPACLRLLIEHGATLEPIHLAHALDDERPEHVRLRRGHPRRRRRSRRRCDRPRDIAGGAGDAGRGPAGGADPRRRVAHAVMSAAAALSSRSVAAR